MPFNFARKLCNQGGIMAKQRVVVLQIINFPRNHITEPQCSTRNGVKLFGKFSPFLE